MSFSVRTFVRSAAMMIAIVGSAMSAHAGLLNLAVHNTGSTSRFDAATQTLFAAGVTDTHWNLVTPGVKVGVTKTIANSGVGSSGSLNFVTDSTKSEYVSWTTNLGNSAVGAAAAPATFIYQTTFSIAPKDAGTTVRFAGTLAAPVAGVVGFLIDGVAVTPTVGATITGTASNSFKAFDFSQYVATAGTHTVAFRFVQTAGSAKNAANIIFTTATATVPEPSTFALLGMGVVGMAVAGYRRRRNAV